MARRTLDVNRLLLIIISILLGVLLLRLEQYGRAMASPVMASPRTTADEVLISQRPENPVPEHAVSVVGENTRAPSETEFAIITMTTVETSYDHIAISNKHNYAKKHGYDMIWDFEPNPQIMKIWDKLAELDKAITAELSGEKSYEWLWMVDYDILITNTSVALEDVVAGALARVDKPEGVHMILTPDCWPLNAGSMLVKATAWNQELIKEWWRGKDIPDQNGNVRSEQDVLRDMISGNVMGAKDKTLFIKQWETNAFPEEIHCYDQDKRPWEPGMFVVHFAGAWAHVEEPDPTGLLMRKYSRFVV